MHHNLYKRFNFAIVERGGLSHTIIIINTNTKTVYTEYYVLFADP